MSRIVHGTITPSPQTDPVPLKYDKYAKNRTNSSGDMVRKTKVDRRLDVVKSSNFL